MTTSFNPLHCGAVVASAHVRRFIWLDNFVSIPFIAGQWSLPGPGPPGSPVVPWFQSPSLRGSGRFVMGG